MSDPFWMVQGTQRRADDLQVVLRGVMVVDGQLVVRLSLGPDRSLSGVGDEPDPVFTVAVGEYVDVDSLGRLTVLDAVLGEGRSLASSQRSSALLQFDAHEDLA